jgi:hypothetical protein
MRHFPGLPEDVDVLVTDDRLADDEYAKIHAEGCAIVRV